MAQNFHKTSGTTDVSRLNMTFHHVLTIHLGYLLTPGNLKGPFHAVAAFIPPLEPELGVIASTVRLCLGGVEFFLASSGGRKRLDSWTILNLYVFKTKLDSWTR